MARKYARDNRGRFASRGGGATARGGRLKTASGKKRESQTMQAKGGRAGTIGKPRGLKPGAIQARAAAKPKPAAKVNLSQAAFERRAKMAETRAKVAEKAVTRLDRFNTSNRRAFRTADTLRSAADSYASYARRGKNNPDFTAADLFKGRTRRSTAPKLSRSEKAAATRRTNADKRFRENVRRMEADRRRR